MATDGFVGPLRYVSDKGDFGFIGFETIDRPDGSDLGITLRGDVFVHRRDAPRLAGLVKGMHLSFYLAPNLRKPGQLRAVHVERFQGRIPQ